MSDTGGKGSPATAARTGRGNPRGLGRGLSALLGGEPAPSLPTGGDRQRLPATLPVAHLIPGKFQPRRHFTQDRMEELTESIRQNGVLQALLVRIHPTQAGRYEIIAGERRWRAAQAAGLHDVPVLLRELDDRDALQAALVENLQREDLSPLEEADAYRRLLEEFGHSQQDVAAAIGRSRSHVANTLRLLALPDPVKAMIEEGKLSAGHARTLLAVPDPQKAAERIVAESMTVRDAEGLARRGRPVAARKRRGRVGDPDGESGKDADTRALEADLSSRLGLPVDILHRGPDGTLSLRYRSLEQLDTLIRLLSATDPGADTD